MAHQTTVNNGFGSSVSEIVTDIGELGNNVVTLATLQAKLAVADLHESARRALPAIVASVILIPLGFASLTVGLIGVGYWLTAYWGISLSQAMMLVAAVGFVFTAMLTVFAVQRLRVSFVSFRRSREELERNLAWLSTVMMHSGR